MRILTVTNLESKEYYETQFFAPEESYRGTCTSKSTIYCASGAACIMVAQLTRWLRGIEVEKEVSCNLLAMEMITK